MPELPEVETTRRGIEKHLLKQIIQKAIVRQAQLRWPIPALHTLLKQQTIQKVARRGKYLLIHCTDGCLIIHLGMSGRLRITPANTPAAKHDHVDIILSNEKILRYTDPRRFGAILWTEEDPMQHTLLKNLGPEPLTENFHSVYLQEVLQSRTAPIKNVIMESKIVVGVGNIYANEALFKSGIHPLTAANKLSLNRLATLVEHIKKILQSAIKQGGTTLKDYYGAEGQKGFFILSLAVYGRAGKPCPNCQTTIKSQQIGQRSSFYCPRCQP